MKVTLTFLSALTFPLLLNGELKTIGKSLVKFTASVGWSAIREAAGPQNTVHNRLPSHFLLFKGEGRVEVTNVPHGHDREADTQYKAN